MRNVTNGSTDSQNTHQLPILSVKRNFLEEIKKNKTTIVVGETASGKTTQIPQFLYQQGYAKYGKIACTQPRRVAAITVAQRVAQEMGVDVGDKVGYCIRFEDKTSSQTKVKFMTDGMLLRESIGDKLLTDYNFIILDEAHERTIHTDVLFGIVKKAQKERTEKGLVSLKLIVMSATMDVDRFSQYFDDAPVLYIEGRLHDIKIKYVKSPTEDYLSMTLSTVIKIHREQPADEDILVFLTGQEEIETVLRAIKDLVSTLPSNLPGLRVFPLHASLPHKQQLRAFKATPKNCRKVVLSTNIAETSVTIHGIKFVIDTGKVKVKTFDPISNMDVLKVQWTSQAQAWQRAGRAGRQSSGVVLRLYTEDTFKNFSENTIPEIQRCNISNVILQLMAIGVGEVVNFDFFDAPSKKTIECAIDELTLLGAINKNSESGSKLKLTSLGRQMSSFPLQPKLSKVLLTAEKYDCVEEMLTVTAMLSADNILFTPPSKVEEARVAHRKFVTSEGDFTMLIKVYRAFKQTKSSQEWCYDNFVNFRSMNSVQEIRKQLRELCVRFKVSIKSSNRDLTVIRRCIAAGMFENAAEYQPDGSYKVINSGQTVFIHPSSCLFNSKPAYVVYNELVETSKCYMRNICVVDADWLYESAPEYFRSKLKITS